MEDTGFRTPITMKNCFICNWPMRHSQPDQITCSTTCHERLIKQLEHEFGVDKKCTRMSTGESFRVPLRDIVEKGVKEQDLDRYPRW